MVRELKVTYIKLNGKSSLLFSAALSLTLFDMASGNRFEAGSVLDVVASAISWVVGALVERGAAQAVKENVHLAEYLTTKMCVYYYYYYLSAPCTKSTLGPTAPCSTVQFIKNTYSSCLLITEQHKLRTAQIKASGGRKQMTKTFYSTFSPLPLPLPHPCICPVYSRCYHTVLFHSTKIHSYSNSYLNLTIMQCCEDLLKSTEMKGNWLNPVPVTVNSVRPGVILCTNTV